MKALEQQKAENDEPSAELISEMRHLTEGQKSLKMLKRVSSCAQVAGDHEASLTTFAEELWVTSEGMIVMRTSPVPQDAGEIIQFERVDPEQAAENEPAAQREAGAAEEHQKLEENIVEHHVDVEARIHVEKKTTFRVEEQGSDDEEGTCA